MKKLGFTAGEIAQATGGEWLSTIQPDIIFDSILTDSRIDCAGALFVALAGENFDAHEFLDNAVKAGASALCINRERGKNLKLHEFGIPVIGVEDTLQAYQDLGAFHRSRLTGTKFVAVTGSSGKTSTKEMLRAIFSEAYGQNAVYATEMNTNNQIGVPQNILKMGPEHKVGIIELGTNHPGEIEPLSRIVKPDIGIITLIGHCHLEHFHSLDAVAREKSAIFLHLAPDGTAVIPEDFPSNEVFDVEAASKKFNIFKFGFGKDADLRIIYEGGNLNGSSFRLCASKSGKKQKINWKISGKHQTLNAAAAACAAAVLGIKIDTIAAGLQVCRLPGMRMRITEKNKVTWINDAYNANPDSMIAALKWLSEFADGKKLVLVLGDMLELGEFSNESHLRILRFAAEQFPEAKIVAVGKAMTAAIKGLDDKICAEILEFKDSASAISDVRKIAKPGKTVFLKGSRGMKLERIEPEL